MFSVNYKDPRPIYDQIKAGLRRMIAEGTLKAGAKVPSVRELAGSLTVNPNTIQRAYRELESEGFLVSVPGRGSFVADDFSADTEQIRSLWEQFDELVQTLLDAGLQREDLCARIRTGGASR